jgi:HAE1 family hydrophobic/amphiphilic exporter-1
VMFMGGIIGKFFKSFAVVVTFGVLVSLFVSLTLTPMLCSRYLKVQKEHGRLYRLLDGMFVALEQFYRHILEFSLAHRWKVVFATIVVVVASGYFFANVGKTFVPDEDEGRFLVFLKTPLGSNIDYTDDRLKEVQKVLASHKEIATYFTAIGLGQAGQVNQGLAFVRMVDPDQRKLKQYELLPILRKELAQIPGVRAFAAAVPIVGGQRGEPLQFVLRGPSLNEVSRLSQELQQTLANDPTMGRLDLDLQLDLPQLTVQVDRTRAASLGLTARDVSEAINMLTGGVNIAKYNDEPGDGQRYDIRLKAADPVFRQASDLSKIYLRSRDGQLVRLDTVVKFKENLGAAVISRFDLQYGGNFYGTPTIPLADAVNRVKQAAAQILPVGYNIQFIGQAEEFAKTANYMAFAFVLALVLLYMVLASQFNSFLQPFIIMVAQPLAIIGGVLALWLMGNVFGIPYMTLNIYSMIGLVLLIGLVAKNSILLVDLTNQRRAEGMAVDVALRDACPIRMRPVLMTSLTVILALLPAALGLGAGAETNGPLAVAVIGGMISSTLLTLVVVPSVYSLVENALDRWRVRHAKAD